LIGVSEKTRIGKRPRASVVRQSCRKEEVQLVTVMRRKAKGARELGNEGRWKKGAGLYVRSSGQAARRPGGEATSCLKRHAKPFRQVCELLEEFLEDGTT
jgi:hypothetical protein